MSTTNSALYSPYGAFELKARYQKNFATGTGLVVGLVALILLTVWVISALGSDTEIIAPTVTIKTISELGPPPTVAPRPPQVKVAQPNVAKPKIGIPKPVADEEVLDEDVQIASREELAEIVAPDITSEAGDANIDVQISEEEYIPKPDEFIPVEMLPEMIKEVQPDYPQLAKHAGLEGIVWVKALVDKEGNVRDAVIGKSSGTAALDEAALKAAPSNKFKPAIQNNRPVNCWVSYRVVFKISQ